MTQLERVPDTVVRGLVLYSRIIVVLFAATLSLASTTTAFAQLPAPEGPQTPGASRESRHQNQYQPKGENYEPTQLCN